MTLDELIAKSQELTPGVEIWDRLRAYCAAEGIARLSYHHMGPDEDWTTLGNNLGPRQRALVKDDFYTSAGHNFHIIAHGFPAEWVAKYIDEKVFEYDPIPMLARVSTDPFLWSEAANMGALSREQRDYLENLAASGIGEGIAIQVFGPLGRDGYFGFALGPDAPRPTATKLRQFQVAAQVSHLAICHYIDATRGPKAEPLSSRETEVLGWIACGKSKAVIADILGISVHTVDTMVRRIFKKLGVADRTSAALKGVAAGLIPAGQADVT